MIASGKTQIGYVADADGILGENLIDGRFFSPDIAKLAMSALKKRAAGIFEILVEWG